MALETFPYDAADFLTDDATISAYLNLALEEVDSSYFVRALGAVARARGRMNDLARELGMPLAALDQSLREGNIAFHTVLVMTRYLGIRLGAELAAERVLEEASAI